jgi:uncharacterized protein YraI
MMHRYSFWIVVLVLLACLSFTLVHTARAETLKQTGPTATVAPPAAGSSATVNLGDQDQINVRSGPGVDYELIGTLLAGQQVPALGRSPGGEWVQITFPSGPGGIGWVYAYLVTVNGSLPVVELPPTPTPKVTPTIDPTLAAQFIVNPPPTRLPTFTPPAPLIIPTYTDVTPVQRVGGSQVVYLMIGLGIVGFVGILLSFIRVR